MKDYLDKYEDDLCEELADADKYACWALEIKEKYPDFAKRLKDIANQELNHYEIIDSMAAKVTTDEVEKKIYDHMHKRHLVKIAEIKYKISLI